MTAETPERGDTLVAQSRWWRGGGYIWLKRDTKVDVQRRHSSATAPSAGHRCKGKGAVQSVGVFTSGLSVALVQAGQIGP